MANNSLGSITVSLLAKSDQFEDGLAKAADATAKFGADVTRNSDQWVRGFTRTNSQWENYLSLGSKENDIGKLSKSFRELGHIVGPQLGGHFLRLAGNIQKAFDIAKRFGNLSVFGGGGGIAGFGMRALPLAGAAYAGAKVGGAIANMTAPGYADKDQYGRSNSIASRIGRLFSEEQAIGKTATAWKFHYRTLLEGRAIDDEINRKFYERKKFLEDEAKGLEDVARARVEYNEALSLGLFKQLSGKSGEDPMETLLRNMKELERATDQESKWDKLTKRIGEARQAIDAIWQKGNLSDETLQWIGKAREQLDAYSQSVTALEDKEKAGALGGGERGGGHEFKVVDSLSRLAGGGGVGQGAGGAQLGVLNQINLGIQTLIRKTGKTPVLVTGG